MTSAPVGPPAGRRTAGGDRAVWDELWPELWRRHGDRFQVMDAPAGTALLRASELVPGERVLDVGCGAGMSTVQAALEVSPTGHVVGVDVSVPMLRLAAERARAASLTNVAFVAADAQTAVFGDGAFDVVVSRFGTMFFADPVAGFTNLARSLRAGGRLAMVVTRRPRDDPWIATVLAAVAPHVGAEGVQHLDDYGSYSLGDARDLDRVLAGAAFRDVERRSLTLPVRVGSDVDDVVAYLRDEPEVQAVLERATGSGRAAALAALAEAVAPFAGPAGVVMQTSVWLVTART